MDGVESEEGCRMEAGRVENGAEKGWSGEWRIGRGECGEFRLEREAPALYVLNIKSCMTSVIYTTYMSHVCIRVRGCCQDQRFQVP